MREIVLKTAACGLYLPFWSARILDEWRRAVVKLGPTQTMVADGEIAMLHSQWPQAEIPANPKLESELYLPDPADCHVLASAIDAKADVIMTLNLKDFPRGTLAEFGLVATHPDEMMRSFFDQNETAVRAIATQVHAEAERLSGQDIPLRKLMKKAGMPRLGKALETQ